MDYYSKQISKLIEELSSLPGIGSKSAQRLAFHILNMPEEQVETSGGHDSGCQKKYPLLQDLLHADRCRGVSNLQQQRTGSFHDYGGRELPGIWQLMKRQDSMMVCIMYCMAQFPRCLESDRKISRLKELMQRLQGDVKEVIIATNSSLEGETTAMYISKLIKPTGIKVSRIASGVPVGGDLEYIDEVTLLRALEGRA